MDSSTTASGVTGVSTTDVSARLQQLARLVPGSKPVVSVYLDTRWTDEHQRERVRVFLKNESRKAAAMAAGELESELAWIVAEGERIVRQEQHPDAAGVAMFAGGTPALREVLYLAVPIADTFAVAETPRLRPLVAALGDTPRAAGVFIDGERATLIPLTEQGAGDETTIPATEPLGQHRRGGWSLLLQSRYQRHIHVHRARHFDAVAQALADLVEHARLRAIVLAGEPRNLAVFRTHVPPRLSHRIAGEIAAARYEPAATLAGRALPVLRHLEVDAVATALDAVLVHAAAGTGAVAGTAATTEAVNRGAVDRLYLLGTYDVTGRVCTACRAIGPDAAIAACAWCGGGTSAVDLGETLVARVLATDGDVASVDLHAALAQAGGVAARLRSRQA